MQWITRTLADVFQFITILCGLASGWLILQVLRDVSAGDPSGQPTTLLFACAIVIVPYCIAGALHRWSLPKSGGPFSLS